MEQYEFFPALRERRNALAGRLSGGEQQMLTISRSLPGNPRLMLIDEPTEGLAPLIVERLVAVIREIRRRGVAILLVEQKMTIALRISDRVDVMGRPPRPNAGRTASFNRVCLGPTLSTRRACQHASSV